MTDTGAPLLYAECREDGVWWRGTQPRAYPIHINTARSLLPRLTGEIAFLAPDLAQAIKEYDDRLQH